jgi:tripartite motif-containing protein 71
VIAIGALLLVLARPPQETRPEPGLLAPLREIGTAPAYSAGTLREPRACAFGRDGRLYVAEAAGHRVAVYGPDGREGPGWGRFGRGRGEFASPSGLAVGPDGELYVADTGNGRVQIFDPDGRWLFEWGAAGPEPLAAPASVAVYGDRAYVAEPDRRRVRVFGLRGEPRLVLGGLDRPSGAAADAAGTVFVADAGAHRIVLFGPDGAPRGAWGGYGSPSGFLSSPGGVAWADGRLLVADTGNHRVQVFDARGRLVHQWGVAEARPGQGGGRLHYPAHVAVAPDGSRTAVAEPLESRVPIFPWRDAPAPRPLLEIPWWERAHARPALGPPPRPRDPGTPGLAALVAAPDRENHAVFVVDVTENTVSRVVARAGVHGRRLGEFNDPVSVAFDAARLRLWVSDRGNRRLQRLAIARVPGRPFEAGPGVRAEAAWAFAALVPGLPADLAAPGSLSLDARGRLLVVDEANAAVAVLDGEDLSLARLLRAPAADGPSRWVSAAASPDGARIYVADALACRILVFDAAGTLAASWGRRGAEPDAFQRPASVAVDASGAVHVLDGLLSEVKTFGADGTFVRRWSAPGQRPLQLHRPASVAFGAPDHLLVDDAGNHMGQIFRLDGRSAGFFIKAGYPAPEAAR